MMTSHKPLTSVSQNIETSTNWQAFENGKSVGLKGSENGTIIYDIEHSGGARVTLEEKTDIAPFATTLGVYGLMFHTRFDGKEADAKEFIALSVKKIDTLLDMYDIPEERRDSAWEEKHDTLIHELAEQ